MFFFSFLQNLVLADLCKIKKMQNIVIQNIISAPVQRAKDKKTPETKF